MRLLILTNLFADPFSPARATFNQQQFSRLAQQVTLKVLVPVAWTEVLRRPLQWQKLRRQAVQQWGYVDYVIFWYPPGFGRSLHALFLLLSLLLQRPALLWQRWDLLLASWASPDAVALAALAWWRRLPLVVKVHGSDLNVFARERLRGAQIGWALRRARRVVTVSQALADKALALGVLPQRLEVLYNGVDKSRFSPMPRELARQALGLPEAGRWVLFVGNLKPVKGLAELLPAFAGVAAQHPDLQLALVGSGPLRRTLTEQARALGVAERVHFMGSLPHTALKPWFAVAQLLCLPSHDEGVPNVVLEAMACGTPVVATRVGGVAEVLPALAGLLVPARDTAALQQALFTALARVWDHEAIAAHAAAFDWDTNVARLRALLEAAAVRD